MHLDIFKFRKNLKLIYRRRKLFLDPVECRTIFLLLRNLQPAEAYNWKVKLSYVWEAPAT